jgi:hypothetical protein
MDKGLEQESESKSCYVCIDVTIVVVVFERAWNCVASDLCALLAFDLLGDGRRS